MKPLVLVTGATGYIGGRLVPRLQDAGYRVRCLVRDATRLQGRAWRDDVETIEGDALQPKALAAATISEIYFGVCSSRYLWNLIPRKSSKPRSSS